MRKHKRGMDRADDRHDACQVIGQQRRDATRKGQVTQETPQMRAQKRIRLCDLI